jgi:hypothetical protein
MRISNVSRSRQKFQEQSKQNNKGIQKGGEMSSKNIGTVVLLLGLVCLVIGGIFIWQSIDVKSSVVNQMKIMNESYGGDPEYITADGEIILYPKKIDGIIDTQWEAKYVADTLMAHRLTDYAPFTQMERDDPARATVIQGMTMETALTAAQMGFGISTMALGIGVFMAVTGLALGATGLVLRRQE